MTIRIKETNGHPELNFEDVNPKDIEYDKVINICMLYRIPVNEIQIQESIKDYLNGYKSSIKLQEGYNLYHPSADNPFYLSFFYDPNYKAYKY